MFFSFRGVVECLFVIVFFDVIVIFLVFFLVVRVFVGLRGLWGVF